MDFVWSGLNFDTNGLFHWLGTNKGAENWTNPAKTTPPRVVVTSSGNGEGLAYLCVYNPDSPG